MFGNKFCPGEVESCTLSSKNGVSVSSEEFELLRLAVRSLMDHENPNPRI